VPDGAGSRREAQDGSAVDQSEAGELGGFTVNQGFLLGTTVYVVIPSLMVFAALVLQPAVNRVTKIVLGILFAVTIVTGAIGE